MILSAFARWIALTALTASAAGQPLRPFELEAIDAGVEDVDPLARGGRLQARDLRIPIGFEHVYRVPGRDDLFMRIDSGLVAVFPRSVYVQTQTGVTPIVPPATRFYPGGLPQSLLTPTRLDAPRKSPDGIDAALTQPIAPERAGPLPMNDFIDLRAENPATSAPRTSPEFSLWSDERFRSARIGSLLEHAADASSPSRGAR